MSENVNLICREVAEIYQWLGENISQPENGCQACGKCCRFESFGHKLFLTTPELLYFYSNIKDLKKMPVPDCPYMQDGKCTARDFRFAGCRIFFCKADDEMLSNLSEQALEKFKKICEKYKLPYRYVDLATALNSSELLELITS